MQGNCKKKLKVSEESQKNIDCKKQLPIQYVIESLRGKNGS